MLLISIAHVSICAQCDMQITAQKMTDLMLPGDADKQVFIANLRDGKPVIQCNEFIIPVTKCVILKAEMNNTKFFVVFYFQKGVAVTSTKDNSWRRAHYELPFPNKKSAKKFIALYKNCSENLP